MNIIKQTVFLIFSLLSAIHLFALSLTPLYDINTSFEENIKKGPRIPENMPIYQHNDRLPLIDFLGYRINSPIGIPACALMTSKGIALASKLGYDILTYKTIRSVATAAPSSPNIYYINYPHQLTQNDAGGTLAYVEDQPTQEKKWWAMTNSFANACDTITNVVQDIARARASLSEGQILIVSVYGSQQESRSYIEDFAYLAKVAHAAGAHAIEANLSCPNLSKKNMLYHDPEQVFLIAQAITQALPQVPLIMKIGYCKNKNELREILRAAHKGGARGICGINSVPMQVLNEHGEPIFGKDRVISGVSGTPIKNLALEFVRDAREIIDNEDLGLALLAAGGVTTPHDFDVLITTGADVALSATGAMTDPYLAINYHKKKSEHICNQELQKVILKLYEIGAIKLDNITIKCGAVSPIYFDLRMIISHPDILRSIAHLTWQKTKTCTFNHLCGVPYTALPIATAIALVHDTSMVMRRKELKSYGTKKLIEGCFKSGDTCLVIEDVITTGSSILETCQVLENEGLRINNIVVFIDREQGGMDCIKKQGYTIQAVCTLSHILGVLERENSINYKQSARIRCFIADHCISEQRS